MQDKSNTNSSVQESYSPKKLTEGGEKKKRSRTRKYSDAQREHKCECGKSYLSYPALYTHLKQKHNGQSLKNLDEQRLDSTFSESQTQDIFTTLANALGKEEDKPQASLSIQDTINLFINFNIISQIKLKKYIKQQSKCMYDLVMWEVQLLIMETDNKEIKMDYYHELIKTNQPSDVTTPQDAFIKFIHEVKGVLSFEQMKLIFLFVYSFRKLLLDFPECPTSGLVEKANQLICSQLDKVLQNIQQLSNRNFIVYSIIENLTIHLCRVPNLRETMIQIVLGFCNWLYARHLTDDKLLLKSDSD